MKKIQVLFAILLLSSMSLVSCGKKKAIDIKVADIKTACEFVDAMEMVMDEVTVLVGDAASAEALSAEKQTELKGLADKMSELDGAASKAFSREEAEKCANFNRVNEKGDKVGKFF